MYDWLKRRFTAERLDCIFVDTVSGEEVFNYKDYDGKKFIANHNHWFFRVYNREYSCY